jgi:hypothetical protein
MIEIQCPFCDEPARMDVATFVAPKATVRCEGCSIEMEIVGRDDLRTLALAA